VCPGFQVDQSAGVELLREVARQDGVRHVRVASGLRHDLALQAPRALKALTMEFTGGQLKVAPEHISERVLRGMRKPGREVFERFLEEFRRHSEAAGKEQYVIPYLISAFPGCTDQDMRELADWLRARGWSPRQVQCFIPTPGTVATAMYFTRLDPEGNPIHVARSDAERLRQHGILCPERGRKPVRSEGAEQGSKPERAHGPERAGRPERGGKPERGGRPEHAGKPERGRGPERTGKAEPGGKPQRGSKPERSGKPRQTGRPEHGAGPTEGPRSPRRAPDSAKPRAPGRPTGSRPPSGRPRKGGRKPPR